METSALVSVTEANRNFSKVTRLVDKAGLAAILKNSKSCYIVANFEEYNALQAASAACRQETATTDDQLIEENLEALQELAK